MFFSRSRLDCCYIFQNCVVKDYFSSKELGETNTWKASRGRDGLVPGGVREPTGVCGGGSLDPKEQEAWWEASQLTATGPPLQAPTRQAQSLPLNKHLWR